MGSRSTKIGIGLSVVVLLAVMLYMAAGATAHGERQTSANIAAAATIGLQTPNEQSNARTANNDKQLPALDKPIAPGVRNTQLTTQTASLFDNAGLLVVVSECAICHGSNYDNFKNPGLKFKHDPHLARGVRCAVCHTSFPHKPGAVSKPPMDVCYNCHGVSHQKQGMVADGSCTLCHPAGFKRLPKDHNAQFKAKDHKEQAIKNSFACVSCHGNDFCVTCHASKKVLPKDHGDTVPKKQAWKKQHGKKNNLDSCAFCHDDKSCASCHQTPMPHPVLWLGSHKEPVKTIQSDCKICHDSKTECSTCHHQFGLATILEQKNCDRCHDDYKMELSVLIGQPKPLRNKGIIIHKAHFEMTKTDPFECSECHERDYAQAKGCFSFQLCYECHGRERGGSLIAKWGGQELCYRCHQRKS